MDISSFDNFYFKNTGRKDISQKALNRFNNLLEKAGFPNKFEYTVGSYYGKTNNGFSNSQKSTRFSGQYLTEEEFLNMTEKQYETLLPSEYYFRSSGYLNAIDTLNRIMHSEGDESYTFNVYHDYYYGKTKNGFFIKSRPDIFEEANARLLTENEFISLASPYVKKKELPKYYCVALTNDSKDEILKRFNKIHRCNYATGLSFSYIGISKLGTGIKIRSSYYYKGTVEISAEDFLRLTEEYKTKSEESNILMLTYKPTLTIAQLKELHHKFTCKRWRDIIEHYLQEWYLYIDTTRIIIDKAHIDLAFEEGSKEMQAALIELNIRPISESALTIANLSEEDIKGISQTLFGDISIMTVGSKDKDPFNYYLIISNKVKVKTESIGPYTRIYFEKQ